MKRWVITLAVIVAVVAGGIAAFERYKIYLPGILLELRDPIQPPRTIVWNQGPAQSSPGTAKRPPNIVVILADDLGYNDITAGGGGVANGLVPTPNIDSIAHEGVTFDIAYAANATCSPSRAAILTGRYPTRFGFEFTAVPMSFARSIAAFGRHNFRPPIYHPENERNLLPVAEEGVPASEITIAEVLRTRGYHTMHIGKWHLGEAPALRPEAQGFDESLGFMAGGSMYLPERDPNVVNSKQDFDPIDRYIWPNLPYAVQWNGSRRFPPTGYLTDYFADQAVHAIEANRNRSFFLYLAFNAPHTPLQASRADYDALSTIPDHRLRVYAAMIRALDRGVGQVLEALRANGLDDNTLVIFTSDNGGAWYVGLPDINRPFRGWKATFFEGGVRVPFFLRWPGQVPAGTHARGPADHLDIFTTAAAAAGASLPNDRTIDGVNLLPFVRAQSQSPPHDVLFWRSGKYRVVRAGNWKLQISQNPPRIWLYDLQSDPTEHVDLSAQQPERVRELHALLDAHDAQMPPPLWRPLIEGPVRIDVPLNVPWSGEQDYIYWSN